MEQVAKMAWNRTWKTSGRQLSEQVVVSVAVDIEARHGPGFWCREKLGKMVTAKEDGDWCWKILNLVICSQILPYGYLT